MISEHHGIDLKWVISGSAIVSKLSCKHLMASRWIRVRGLRVSNTSSQIIARHREDVWGFISSYVRTVRLRNFLPRGKLLRTILHCSAVVPTSGNKVKASTRSFMLLKMLQEMRGDGCGGRKQPDWGRSRPETSGFMVSRKRRVVNLKPRWHRASAASAQTSAAASASRTYLIYKYLPYKIILIQFNEIQRLLPFMLL